jgi:hypothetical protein
VLERKGNIWIYYGTDSLLVVPTNGTVKSNGECVMGRGLALQAKTKFPALPSLLGDHIKAHGNTLEYFPLYSIVTFPVKWDWHKDADKLLIYRSLKELVKLVKDIDLELEQEDKSQTSGSTWPQSDLKKNFKIYLTRVGCGNGNLDWKDIKPLLEEILTKDRFIVVDRMS